MYLSKLLLKDYGKFNNEELKLNRGINIVYGTSASGKTTLRDFIVSIFYGNLPTEKYEVSDSRVMSGKAYLVKDEKTYFVEQEFGKSNITKVMDVVSGREVSLNNSGSLYGSITDVDQEAYTTVSCINDIDATSSEINSELRQYIASMTECGSLRFNKSKAIEILKNKRDALVSADQKRKISIIEEELSDYDDVEDCLKYVRDGIKKVEEDFALETAKRKREARKLIQSKKGEDLVEDVELNSDLDRLVHNSVFLDPELMKDYLPKKKLTDKIWFILLTGLFVIAVVSAMVCILPLTTAMREIFIVCITLFVIVTIVEGLIENGTFSGENQMPSQEEFEKIIYTLERKQEAFEDVEIDMEYAKEFYDKMSELRDLENEFLQRQAKKQELLDRKKEISVVKDDIEKERHALNLAINTINDVSEKIGEKYRDLFGDEMNMVIAYISNNEYMGIEYDSKTGITVDTVNGKVKLSDLEKNKAIMIRLAIRIGMIRKLCKENMPVILDDAFSKLGYDETNNIVKCLNSFGFDQIIITTRDDKFKNVFDDIGLDYNYLSI